MAPEPMSPSFDLEAPDHFIAGAMGPSGQRVFYLQAAQSHTLVTLKCEKEQVRGLGQYLADLLARLGIEASPHAVALLEPIEPAWAVASLGVGYDAEDDRILVVAQELLEEESTEEPATARFRITRAQAAAFVECTRELMKAGRPICPICGRPKDPDGHVCPRSNGYGAR